MNAKEGDIVRVKFRGTGITIEGRVIEVAPQFLRVAQSGGFYGGIPENVTIIKSTAFAESEKLP